MPMTRCINIKRKFRCSITDRVFITEYVCYSGIAIQKDEILVQDVKHVSTPLFTPQHGQPSELYVHRLLKFLVGLKKSITELMYNAQASGEMAQEVKLNRYRNSFDCNQKYIFATTLGDASVVDYPGKFQSRLVWL